MMYEAAAILGIMVQALVGGVANDELTLADRGKSDCQVVLPGRLPSPAVAARLALAARLIQNAFGAAGARVPVVEEGRHDPSKPCLYLGDTLFARARGVDAAKLEGWGYAHRVVGKDVIIAGRDEPSTADAACRVGTLKGVADFLRQYAGTRFLYPSSGADDSNSIEFAESARIAVPSSLNVVKIPMLLVNYEHRVQESPYHIANNMFPRVDLLGGGHSHAHAVPPEKYRKTHPEYFALLGGGRATDVRRAQYCLSNPEVQELLYRYHLDMFDKGYAVVGLGQQDAFQPCRCENCRGLFGAGDDWGEKIWILNKTLSERLLEARPGKKVLALAYTVTERPPKTFTRFPANMMVMLCGTNDEDFKEWGRMDVPAGFMAYIYNWGVYHCGGGYTPKRTPKHVELQARRFARNKIRGIYKDGFGELFGLEGPVYYVFGRMYDDPEKNTAEALLDEFCSAAFGRSAGPMRRFYDRLYKGIEHYSDEIGIRCPNWSKSTRDSFELIHSLYKPELLAALESDLKEAEGAADTGRARARIRLVRWEFNYLRSLARVVNLYYEHKARPDDKALLGRLLDAIDARNAEVRTICDPRKRAGLDGDGGWSSRLFPKPGHGAEHLQLRDDRYRSRFKETAVNWDTGAMRKSHGIAKPVVKPGGRTEDVGDFERRR